MKFRIKKITYKSGDIAYYPQVKLHWWGCWLYFHYSYCKESTYFREEAVVFSNKEGCIEYLKMKEKDYISNK